jgi:hypothetical protein
MGERVKVDLGENMVECMKQLDLFALLERPKKTQREEDILYAVNHGSGFELGKARILNFYNRQNPSLQQFSQYLSDEYGLGGCGGSGYNCSHNANGIEFKRYGREYKFNWLQWAKEVAKVIDSDEYDCDNMLKYCTYYKLNSDSPHLTKKVYSFGKSYAGKKTIVASLHTEFDKTEDDVFVRYYGNANLLIFTNIFIGEIIRAIESGAYNTTEEIWEDIFISGRQISGATFGGTKRLDVEGINDFFERWKATGYCLGFKSEHVNKNERLIAWEFWCSRAYRKGLITHDLEIVKEKK